MQIVKCPLVFSKPHVQYKQWYHLKYLLTLQIHRNHENLQWYQGDVWSFNMFAWVALKKKSWVFTAKQWVQYIPTTSNFLVEKLHLTMVILMIDTLQPIVCHLSNHHKLSPMTRCRTLPVYLRILLLLQQVGHWKLR